MPLSPRTRALAASLLLLGTCAWAGSPGVKSPSGPEPVKLTVHEWGTFLSVQGSDGVPLGGMVDSEEELPLFVRERSLDGYSRGSIFYKMETPVTYFYVDQPTKVEVKVGMPKGVLTHWFPAVRGYGPSDKATTKAESYLDWGRFDLIPDHKAKDAKAAAPALRPLERDETWRFARETDAAFVRVSNEGGRIIRSEAEAEKFLFYRGVGAMELPLIVRSSGEGSNLKLKLENFGAQTLDGVFAVEVGKEGIRFAELGELGAAAAKEIQDGVFGCKTPGWTPLKDGVPRAKDAVAASLVHAGLYEKEARAMVNTWEKSYFQTPGLRMLYVLPRPTVDEVIPIQIKPEPEQLVRVMVGRVEVLTPDRERAIETAVADLKSADAQAKKTAEAELAALGRFKEPVMHRIVKMTKTTEVRKAAETLIEKAANPK